MIESGYTFQSTSKDDCLKERSSLSKKAQI